jgi:hypothetical protein
MKEETVVAAPKPARNQFKCFHCRLIFASKDGDWHAWNTMEVHLCQPCEKETRARPERKTKSRS